MRLVVNPNVEKALAALPDEDQAEAESVLSAIPAAFGRPHVHSGLGIRNLRSGVYEVRVGLHLRAVFNREGDSLVVRLVGNHDDVRRYLRSL